MLPMLCLLYLLVFALYFWPRYNRYLWRCGRRGSGFVVSILDVRSITVFTSAESQIGPYNSIMEAVGKPLGGKDFGTYS